MCRVELDPSDIFIKKKSKTFSYFEIPPLMTCFENDK